MVANVIVVGYYSGIRLSGTSVNDTKYYLLIARNINFHLAMWLRILEAVDKNDALALK